MFNFLFMSLLSVVPHLPSSIPPGHHKFSEYFKASITSTSVQRGGMQKKMLRRSNRKRPFARRTAAAIVLLSSLATPNVTLMTAALNVADVVDVGGDGNTNVDTMENSIMRGGIDANTQDIDLLHDTVEMLDTTFQEDLDADLYDENFDDVGHQHGEQDQGQSLHGQGHWGTPPTVENGSTIQSHTFVHKDKTDNNHTILNPHIHPITHPPPDAFTLTAKIKQRGGKSFFEIDTTEDGMNSIPFMECNSVGTTTPPIPAGSVSFRSFTKSGHPTSWTYTHGFIVPLSSIEIEVQTTSMAFTDSGKEAAHSDAKEDTKKLIFNAGEIIWVDGEYRMSSAGEQDLTALIIDVPKKEGKTRDIFGLPNREIVNMMNCNESDMMRKDSTPMGVVKNLAKDVPIRRTILASLGLSLSSLLTYFWIKVAPLQLAVGIGGTCLIAGGSLGIVIVGESVFDEIEAYLQKAKEERERLDDDEDETN